MTAYSPTNWQNNVPPPLSAANLNKLTDELEAQASELSITESLPTWADGTSPALTDAAPLNEMERVAADVATAVGLSYIPTTWSSGWVPARNAARFNRLEAQAAANRSAIDTPPPTGDAYFDVDYSSGLFAAPWTLLFSYTSPGYQNLGSMPQTPDGRVSVVANPSGGAGKAARFEIRDADPSWASDTSLDKSEVRTDVTQTWNTSAGVSAGDVRWFSTPIYLPYNATEKFEWAHGGSNPFTALIGLHPGSSTAWSAYGFRWYPAGDWQSPTYTANQYFQVFLDGGDWATHGAYDEYLNVFRLTDASANRYMANYNRWINFVWGARFAPDSTGWAEIWVDGVNVLPRRYRPTMWSGDSQAYIKYGIYKQADASFPETGRSVLYFGHTTISYSRPF